MHQFIGVAEAKRRFSELLDRVGTGEQIVIARRGKPTVALVPPDQDLGRGSRPSPIGFAAIAGALADWDDIDDVVDEIYAGRRKAKDRPPPTFD